MSLLQRIEKLETAQKSGADAATHLEIDALNGKFAVMSNEELDALIAEGEAIECDPDDVERLSRLGNYELCRLILEGERA